MKNIIENDFGVETIFENKKEILFFKLDHFEYKFVWINENEPFNRMEQFNVLRYELANHLYQYVEDNTDENTCYLTTGEQITFKGKMDHLETTIKTIFSETVFVIPNKNNSFIKTLLIDNTILQSLQENLTPKIRAEILSELIDDDCFDKEIQNKLTNKDLEIIQFERVLSDGLNKTESYYSFSRIYKILINKNLTDIQELKDLLIANFDYIYHANSCDCGSEGCFFDILKENQLYFFNKNYKKNGAIDLNEVTKDFDNIWEGLSFRKKASLMFLYIELGNSTLLNLAFVKPNFDLRNYQHLMCFNYQPDSEDEVWIRTVSAYANYFKQI